MLTNSLPSNPQFQLVQHPTTAGRVVAKLSKQSAALCCSHKPPNALSTSDVAILQEHEVSLDNFKVRIAQAGLQLPPALLVNGDVDATLLRFLRARKYHVEHALAMLESKCAVPFLTARLCEPD